MTLVILSTSPNGRVAQRILREALQRGIEDARVVDLNDVAMLLEENLSGVVVLPRIAPEQNDLAVALKALEDRGAYVINSYQSWVDSRDKWRTFELLSEYDIATPDTRLAVGGVALVDLGLGEEVLFKPLHGTHGDGIVKLTVGDTIPLEPGVLQSFIPGAANSDIRLFVVGDEVVAAMQRIARDGDFRANLHQGASASAYIPSEAMKAEAIAASRALGLEVAGVDILPSGDSGFVIEANPSPGLGIESHAQIDVVSRLLDYVIAQGA